MSDETIESEEWYNNPDLIEFCKEKGDILPPPYWNPTGTSGEWYWEEDPAKMPKFRRIPQSAMAWKKLQENPKKNKIKRGCWLWREDTQPPLPQKSKKPWYRRLFGP